MCPELDLGALTVEDWLRKQSIPETVTLMNPISGAGYFGNLYICSKRKQRSQETEDIVLQPRACLVETLEERNGLLGVAPEMGFPSHPAVIIGGNCDLL